jgi:hypothetical protein
MPPPPPGSLIRTAAELTAAWQALMGAGGFGRRSIWVIFFDPDHRLLAPIMPIDDIPAEPDSAFLGNLATIVGYLIDQGTVASAAFLLSRPGARAMTGADRRWALALRAAMGDRAGWPIHLATGDSVQVFAPDDLIAAS